MPAIAAVVANLLARPRPILCLDTCDLLDIIQCVAEGKARRLEHVRRLIDTLALRPERVQLVVSYLVPIEWRRTMRPSSRTWNIRRAASMRTSPRSTAPGSMSAPRCQARQQTTPGAACRRRSLLRPPPSSVGPSSLTGTIPASAAPSIGFKARSARRTPVW